jgi:trk system potassium uptake protein TrkA
LEAATGARIAFITRYGGALLPQSYTVLQDGDLIHALYAPGNRESVEAIFEHGPEAS